MWRLNHRHLTVTYLKVLISSSWHSFNNLLKHKDLLFDSKDDLVTFTAIPTTRMNILPTAAYVTLYNFIKLLTALIAIMTNSFSTDWIFGDDSWTNYILLRLDYDRLGMSRALFSEKSSTPMMYCMQQISAENIHIMHSPSISPEHLYRILNVYFVSCSRAPASIFSAQNVFSCYYPD